IDPALPLTTHARVWCQDGTGAFPSATGSSAASCSSGIARQTPGGPITSDSIASVDLSQGTMRSFNTTRTYFDGTQNLRVNAGTELDIYDTLTVNGNFTGNVELRLEVDGSLFDNMPGTLF